MIHERSEEMICGAIMPDGGIQALEVMLYTIDQINKDPDFLPGIRLGVLAKDDCDRDIYGLEQSVDFIRGSIANIGGSAYKCKDGAEKNHDLKIIPGVLAAPSSVTSIQVANLLKIFKISQFPLQNSAFEYFQIDEKMCGRLKQLMFRSNYGDCDSYGVRIADSMCHRELPKEL
ncbi:metabotropic glutamate receptor 2-like [Octopus vulgaris]|uniref:Metabotropic glutamate receptor 2-like n=1 Tax=Octopus vulgaris TaxID=6645 RepID=A0AA36FBJ9_OCTVU|nr:metabotropic glutamate receptor 2-like [Octopus vulgaris]